ncbi:TRAP transporter substrate-binding protein [Gramella sp. AN32]|uniref:TRAP transporter substrate-binding protein n=1 Tax=Christiangramia antarctica TaxID=2058158 RepID=A0ABW5X601_9FLAO|nr:TRAP transporter substrate-binding protein [Gramella sp. AN32]MCM4154843.1 TRAP transporter substrate-binding protein DctP [Gramella sp. AN32]
MKHRFLFPVFLLFLGVISCNSHKEIKILRLAHGLDTQHPVHKAMVILGERLEEKSGGKLKLRIYPSAQLGGERETLELLQIGSLDITKVSAAVLENFIPEYKVFSVPYLFRNKEHSFQVFDGEIGQELLNKGNKFRLRGLTFYDAGSRSFYTKENPINSPKDLEGLKIRVQKSNMAVAMVNDLGGAPTPISYGELYTALQQGVVDGAENNLPSFYTSKHYEVCKYYSMDQHTAVPDVLLIGLDTWEILTEQQKKWLQEATAESTVAQRKLWAASEKESLEEIKKAGVNVIYPDIEPFEEKTKVIINMFKEQPEMLELIKKIKATK